VAAPTPPLGVPPAALGSASPLAATALAPGDNARRPTPLPQRPPAPQISFGSRAEPALAPRQLLCPSCGSANQPSVRFCVACGYLVVSAVPPAAGTPAPAPATPRPANRGPTGTVDLSGAAASPGLSAAGLAPEAPPPIAPARVVEFVATAAPSAPRLCSRCHAPSDGGAQFCRLCGAPLGEPAASVARAVPPAPAPAVASSAAPPHSFPSALPAPAQAQSPMSPRSTVATSPRAVPAARLVLIGRDGNEGLSYPLGEATDIGRTEGTVLLGEDRYVSPRHARIAFRTGSYHLRDLGSTNGVFFRIPFRGGVAFEKGGAREGRISSDSEEALEDQDLFLVGQQVLRFEVVKDADEGFGVASDNGTLLFGTPATPRFARLAQRTVEGVVRDVFNIRKAETVLGRESGDIVFPDDPFLSRRHAMLRVHGTETGPNAPARRFTLSDLGSSNGTFLKIHTEIQLHSGDHFRIGQQLFRFDLDGATNAA